MKVNFVNSFFYPFRGGTENYMLDLAKYLVSRGHEVSVIASREPGQEDYSREFGIDVHRVPSVVFYKLPSFLPPPYSQPLCFSYTGYRLLKKISPDCIHVHSRYFPGFYPVILHKRLLHKPMFLTIHNSKPEDINWQTNFFGRAYDDFIGNVLMRSCDFIFGNSQYSLDVTLPPDYDKSRSGVAYNGIYTDVWKKKKTPLKDDFGCEYLLLSDARLVPQKGMEYLIKAVSGISEDFHLVIKGRFEASGYGYEKMIRAMIKKQKLSDRITIIPQRLSEEEMITLYSAADQFVLPSLHEPFGIVLIQAMATETPIIATNVGGIPEVVADTAITVPSRNAVAIREGILSYMRDKNLARKNAKRARERVVKRFDWKVVGRDVERVYERFYNGKNR
ncbi:MAG: glycosyltransferase family 4 protein [archaeon]